MTSITAQNTFTDAVLKQAYEGYSVSISGTFSATITVQRSPDGTTWYDIDSYTAAIELDGWNGTAHYIRAGCKTGGYTSGTAVVNVR